MRLRLLLTLLPVWICVTARTEPVSIRVGDQASFDSLGREIRVCLAGGAEEVEVSLGPGPFFFRRGPISLVRINGFWRKERKGLFRTYFPKRYS